MSEDLRPPMTCGRRGSTGCSASESRATARRRRRMGKGA
eukprot:CAMPEP_0175620056 /NCGR_PEP_ID=MMETSP0096-20121207/67724_1 /TAXON_ID=311494 /ORGANISM="Alexandrium monilatum, Strain CCMP3105" /LENGTH=38 /DNA_ID= /DNA_START= /DNA_END= /DNA_ORIENTATION=